MALFSCFYPLVSGKNKRSKESNKLLDLKKGETNVRTQVKPIDPENQQEVRSVTQEAAFDTVPTKPKATSNEDAAYEGGDEHDDILSMKRDNSDLDLHARANSLESLDNKSERDEVITPDLQVQSGHVSDPGMGRTMAFWGSPGLKRSCSYIETKRSNLQTIKSPTRSQSYTDLKNLSGDGNFLCRIQSSPVSVKSNCSADRVMLKKRSSSQVLPSRSRKVWWKLFLWSHRNLHKSPAFARLPLLTSASHQKTGYSSDTLEPSRTLDNMKKKAVEESGNQWVAFAMDSSSSFNRINAWINSIEETEFCSVHDDDDDVEQEDVKNGGFVLPISSEIGESSGKNHSSHAGRRTMEEIMQANNVIGSLNFMSSVAHISSMGLKVIPSISAFSSLRTINLSGNSIVQINPGSLPKNLQTLDLSRNKITTIEGLRELAKLRVLNLSYNRISRIGHGKHAYCPFPAFKNTWVHLL